MEKIDKVHSPFVVLDIDNIDTDQIIPARFLKSTNKSGYGEKLFYDWRYDSKGSLKLDFPLNRNNSNVKILVAGENFGCGSSREHAAWALHDYGFRVIVSTHFADIFKNNALNNGLLPIEVSPEFYEELLEEAKVDSEISLLVDLSKEEVCLMVSGIRESFKINPHKKQCLLKGQNDLDYLIHLKDEIVAFEKSMK